jgi:hypothetical protein
VTTGTPWPATAAAKVEAGLVGYLTGAREPVAETLARRPWRFETEWAAWLLGVDALLPPLVVAGAWALWRRYGRAAVPVAVLLLHPVGMALLAPYRGPGFQSGRYSIHLVPLAVAVAIAGVDLLAGLAGRHRRAVTAVLAALVLAGGLWPLPRAATAYAWGVQNIEAMQVDLGRWVAANTPRDARVALNDVGAIAFVSRRQIVDVMGLVTPAIIPYRRGGEAGVLRYLEAACPDYLIVFPAWFPALSAMRERFTPVHSVRLAHNVVAGASEMVVYETQWNRWRAGSGCAGAPDGLRKSSGTPPTRGARLP